MTACLFLMASGCRESAEDIDLSVIDGLTMGTTYTVKAVPNSHSDLRDGIEKTLDLVNRQMSVFRTDSEISRFNRYRGSDWFSLSPDTARVVARAISVSEISGGAFDITVAPLVNLWGFGPKARQRVPKNEEIIESLNRVGYQHIALRRSPPSIRKKIREVALDLAAIAKGYGVDRVAEFLDSKKVSGYLIEIGGEVRAKGKNRNNRWWRIGIASPTMNFGIQKVIELRNLSMATSGDYRNYFQEKGVRYSHTIDPHTGRPVTHSLVSVTVVHRSCMVADALATALNVLGPDRGFDLAQKENLAAYFIIKSSSGFVDKSTKKFNDLTNIPGE